MIKTKRCRALLKKPNFIPYSGSDYVLNILGGPNPFTPEAQANKLNHRFSPLRKGATKAIIHFRTLIAEPFEIPDPCTPEKEELLRLYNHLHDTFKTAADDLEELLDASVPDWASIISETDKLCELTDSILEEESWSSLKEQILNEIQE